MTLLDHRVYAYITRTNRLSRGWFFIVGRDDGAIHLDIGIAHVHFEAKIAGSHSRAAHRLDIGGPCSCANGKAAK